MKQLIFATIMVLFFYSCGTTKNQKMNQSSKKGITTIIGTVISEKGEMDGSVFKVKTENNTIYEALISIPNLGKNEYIDIKKGEEVALVGEVWKMGKENNLTVSKIITNQANNFKVTGIVKSIQHGDDGSVYKVITNNKEVYLVGITFIDMGSNSNKIKDYKVGDKIEVVGKLWKLGEVLHVTAKDIIDNSTIVIGEVRGMGKATDGVDGFMLQVQGPNDNEYDANFNETSLMSSFNVGDRVALEGNLKFSKYLYVKNVISRNTNAFTVEGIVENIENGGDGYVASIKTTEGNRFKAIISVPNLGKNREYKRFSVGDKVKVKGEYWRLGNENRITVREIL
ncbi:hypothetical protein [Tenacibaculum mesophilum]|uniref:hypothetical protein n=1 Tax=Tenacibaculum mesophilum TaxID=104268 RepID=UPI00249329FB|nr:hypothetical protein [Tenacibaculum mesophilum]